MCCRSRLSFLFLPFVILGSWGCSEQDARSIKAVSSKAWWRVRTLSQEVGDKFGLSVCGPAGLGDGDAVSARVSARLRWDQVLQGADIRAASGPQGVVLTGTVTSDIQRRRAVELTESTVGVSRVVDSLKVDPSR